MHIDLHVDDLVFERVAALVAQSGVTVERWVAANLALLALGVERDRQKEIEAWRRQAAAMIARQERMYDELSMRWDHAGKGLGT